MTPKSNRCRFPYVVITCVELIDEKLLCAVGVNILELKGHLRLEPPW